MDNLNAHKMLFRRGLKELDIILESYLHQHYQTASKTEIKELKILLDLEDHHLLALILSPPLNQSKELQLLYKKLQLN
jgi:succinate dehydrogenase flavin-adding protein (antitoxin of CptAB toxin-antitoxin module)